MDTSAYMSGLQQPGECRAWSHLHICLVSSTGAGGDIASIDAYKYVEARTSSPTSAHGAAISNVSLILLRIHILALHFFIASSVLSFSSKFRCPLNHKQYRQLGKSSVNSLRYRLTQLAVGAERNQLPPSCL